MKQFSDLFDEPQVYEVQRPHRAEPPSDVAFAVAKPKGPGCDIFCSTSEMCKKTSVQM